MKPVAVIKYSEFHKTPPPGDSFSLLKQYPTDFIVLRLSKINHFLFHEANNQRKAQTLILNDVFPNLPKELTTKISTEFSFTDKGVQFAFFTGPTTLKLINLALLNFHRLPVEDRPVSLSQFEKDLFNSILICNDLYFDDFLSRSDLRTYESIWRLQMMQQMNFRDHIELIFLAPIRNFLFHKYMITDFPDGREYLKEFAKNLELQSYFEYNMLFQGITHQIINEYKETERPKHIVDPSDAQRKILQSFALKPEYLQKGKYNGETHGELIPHPFYTLDKHLVILDLYFFNYIVDIALIYNVYHYSSIQRLPHFKTFSDFKGTLGRTFYEQFIMKEIFKKLYVGKNYSLLDSEHDSSFPDFTLVRNQRDILFIEIKSSALNYKAMQELSVDEFKNFLDKNFRQEKVDAKTKNRGVYQLIKHISSLADSDLLDKLLREPERKQRTIIYPVIVYTDNSMDMAGVNSYLNEDFQRAVSPFITKFRKINPVTAINLGFFLRYFLKLKEQPTLLFDLITDYWKKVGEVRKEFDSHPHPMPFFKYNISFDQYVSEKIRNNDPIKNFSAIVKDLDLAKE
jgi:hypothetical protein